MVIQKIRNTTQNKKTWLGVMVAVLIFGLLGSYFIWQSPDFSTDGTLTPEQIEKQLAAYAESIEKAKAELEENPNDYTLLMNLGSLYQAQGEFLGETEKYNEAPTSYANSIDYYTKALENKPEELSAKSEAEIYGKIANANWVIGYNEGAEQAFDKALSLDVTNWSINYMRIMYLFAMYGIDEALEAAQNYQALVKDDAELNKNAEQLVSRIQEVKDSMEEEKQQQTDENKDTPDEGEGQKEN